MRIVQLTGGTGNSFCGTCIRDNTLVVELRRLGHDAVLTPLYLPLTLEEPSATDNLQPAVPSRPHNPQPTTHNPQPTTPLFYGGINVYLQQKSALFRKTPRWMDAVLDSPGLLHAAAKRAGMTRPAELGQLTLSVLRGEHGSQVKELDRLTDWLVNEEKPDVVLLSNLLFIGLARRIRERTGAVVLCFLNGEDTFLDGLPEPERQESWDEIASRACDVDYFLPVSHYYGELMRHRASLPAERVRVVYPGISLEGYGREPSREGASPELRASSSEPQSSTLNSQLAIGYLARMCRGKGLEILVRAYLILRQRSRLYSQPSTPNPQRTLRLRIAGSCTDADGAFVDGLRREIEAAGFSADVDFHPNIDRTEKIAFLHGLSALSVPATYGEAFGLYILEALAAGVPVVQPRDAAFPEIIEMTGGGVLCEPNSAESLADALESLLANPDSARAMGERGRRAVRDGFTAERMARDVLSIVESARGNSPRRRKDAEKAVGSRQTDRTPEPRTLKKHAL